MNNVALSRSQKMLRKFWYAFWRLIERYFFQGHVYSLHVPYGHRIFTPWFEKNPNSEFSQVLRMVKESGPLVVSPDRCYVLFQLARRTSQIPGDLAECGVDTGGSAHLLALVLERQAISTKKLHFFDTFAGMPKTSIPSRDYHSPGDFADTSVDFVKNRLRSYDSFCIYHVGLMPDTFSEVEDVKKFSFVHVDVDIFPSVLACCEYFYPRLSRGGVMVFDDYGFYPYRHSVRATIDNFFANKNDKPIILPTGQALIIKI